MAHAAPAFVALHDRKTDQPDYPGQDIRDRTFRFACRVVRFCQPIFEGRGVGRLLVPQIVGCSTSVSSMLEEARAAESRRDFISKCCIALKECREAWTRLRIAAACRVGDQKELEGLVREADELVAIITTIVRNSRGNS
jgi:four helix bundle protein